MRQRLINFIIAQHRTRSTVRIVRVQGEQLQRSPALLFGAANQPASVRLFLAQQASHHTASHTCQSCLCHLRELRSRLCLMACASAGTAALLPSPGASKSKKAKSLQQAADNAYNGDVEKPDDEFDATVSAATPVLSLVMQVASANTRRSSALFIPILPTVVAQRA
jgi:hypothetical protein